MRYGIKIALTVCFLLLGMQGVGYANPKVGQILDHEWQRCESDQDCVVYYACEDIAINRLYYEVVHKMFWGCDAWKLHDALAKTKCVNDFCEMAKKSK